MKKKYIKFIIVSLIIITTAYLFFAVQKKAAQQSDIENKRSKLFLNGNQNCISNENFGLDKTKTVVVIFYSLECNHCEETLSSFEEEQIPSDLIQFIFVSSATEDETIKYLENYQIDSLSNYCFIIDNDHSLYQHYAISTYPETFVYNSGELIKHYKGEINAKILLNNITK